jgi:hypothetical protein
MGNVARKQKLPFDLPHERVSPRSGGEGQPCGRCPGRAEGRTDLERVG